MIVHLIDGTYELFRQSFGRPRHPNPQGLEVGGARAVVRGVVSMLEDGHRYIGVATDQVVESFRNDLYDGYKTGEGLDPAIRNQFEPLEVGLAAIGVALFAMTKFEADDGLASAAATAAADPEVEKVIIYTPDKDLSQCVRAGRVVQFDRRNNKVLDVEDVVAKYGVKPESIPDWLALVGDTADGFPGLAGWGAKSSAVVLSRYDHIERIPLAAGQWDITVRGGSKLAKTLADNIDDAHLFKKLATLREDCPTISGVEDMLWTGPTDRLEAAAKLLDANDLVARVNKLANLG